jgi:hypothetical protein
VQLGGVGLWPSRADVRGTLHTKHPKLQMSMFTSQDFVSMSSGARRATGVMGMVVLAVAGWEIKDAEMGLVSGLQLREHLLG